MSADRLLEDPRPDLGDGAAYGRLLACAWMLDGPDPGGTFGALHFARCLGADLAAVALARGRAPVPKPGDVSPQPRREAG